MPVLISLSGLPGVGKTTIAREFSRLVGAIHLRVDTIEAAMKISTLKIHPAEDAGYVVAVAIAKDNLALGFDVIADTVNPIEITRNMWADAAADTNASLMNVVIVCSDKTEHQRRVETRASDICGLVVPSWEAVQAREYHEWSSPCIIVNSALSTPVECAREIVAHLTIVKKSIS